MKSPTNPRVVRRFIILMSVTTFVMFSFWAVVRSYVQTPEGDYEVRQGDIFLSDEKYRDAIKAFDEALKVQPDHRGALSGQAVAYMGLKEYKEADSLLTYLIDFLKRTLEDDDKTGRGALSAAYANRGIIKDRQGRYEAALEDYIKSIRVDRDLADGPGVAERLLDYE